MEALYNLSRYPANFNFLEFLVASRTIGADRILFSGTPKPKFTPKETQRRIDSILLPACALAGCSYHFGYREGAIDPGYHMDAVLEAYWQYGMIEKLKSVKPPGSERYTVTLRNMKRYEQRNSSSDWRRFAKEIGAFVVEDYEDQPIHLHDRMALYAGAEMNYFVANGPGTLCLLSDYPYTMFMHNVDLTYHEKHKYPKDTQLPWRIENQRYVWEADTYENLIKAHERRSSHSVI